jgi:hypothetical protein
MCQQISADGAIYSRLLIPDGIIFVLASIDRSIDSGTTKITIIPVIIPVRVAQVENDLGDHRETPESLLRIRFAIIWRHA